MHGVTAHMPHNIHYRGLTQVEISPSTLAKATGASKSYISRVLRGQANITLQLAAELASSMGVSIDMLHLMILCKAESESECGATGTTTGEGVTNANS